MQIIVLLEPHMCVPESIQKEFICKESVIDHTTHHTHYGDVVHLNGSVEDIRNWVITHPLLWITNNPKMGWNRMEFRQNKTPEFRIPKSEIAEFSRWYKTQTDLRYGQAFHQHFRLEKMVHDKNFCDRLYQAEYYKAKRMVASITDHEN